MSKTLPWYKRDVDAWRGGTRGMNLELRGFYSELLDAMWDQQGPIPNDDSKLAMIACVSKRTVRKLLPQLIALGKVIATADGLINERMESEILAANSKPIRTEFDRNSDRIRPEFRSKNPKNPMFSTRDLEVEEDKEKEREEDSHQLTSEQDPVSGCVAGSDFIKVADEALQAMVRDAATWLGDGITPAGARRWITGMVSAHGKLPVAKAYHHTLKGLAQGAVRNPANYWPATAERMARGVDVPLLKSKPNAYELLAQVEAELAAS